MRSVSPALIVVLATAFTGCVSKDAHTDDKRTIVVHDATREGDRPAYDTGERHPDRIEVVVSDPRSGAAIGPSPLVRLVGQTVKVQFRRDLLGQSAAAPIPPTGQGPGGRAVSVMGTLRTVSGGWITVERDRTTYWIPQASILLIEQAEGATTAPSVE
jgi:hypothetical protein